MIKQAAKVFFAFISILTISSCERKNCNNVVCPTNQACNNGQCYCIDGLEGPDCATQSYLKYTVLNNHAFENCNSQPPFSTNSVYISWNGQYNNRIQINGLMGNNCYDITAIIYTDNSNEGNTIEIPEQYCGSNTISGQGTYDKLNRRLNLQLYYNVSGTPYTCTTTLQ
jgi:hypothetical protein